MLTDEQEKYLQTIPEEKSVNVYPWDPNTEIIAEKIMQKAKQAATNLEVLFMGASALKIPGQNDIDIYMLCSSQDFDEHLLKLKEVFGEPIKTSPTSIKWEMDIEGFSVELYLTDPGTPQMHEQIRVYELLKDNPRLLEEYKQIKESANGMSMREYQRRKYEFYNRILDKTSE